MVNTLISVDVEADGPAPGLHSMVCFGAIVVEPVLDRSFYGQTAPISNDWLPDALAISGFTRERHQEFQKPAIVMTEFAKWLDGVCEGRPVFISDNPAFDWQFINYYFHRFLGKNPFGFSARRIGDLYCGMKMDGSLNSEWKRVFRKTKHTHNPVDDAKGNAEAILAMRLMGLKI